MGKEKKVKLEDIDRELKYKAISDLIDIICASCKDKFSTIYSKSNEEVSCPNCGYINKTKK